MNSVNMSEGMKTLPRRRRETDHLHIPIRPSIIGCPKSFFLVSLSEIPLLGFLANTDLVGSYMVPRLPKTHFVCQCLYMYSIGHYFIRTMYNSAIFTAVKCQFSDEHCHTFYYFDSKY